MKWLGLCVCLLAGLAKADDAQLRVEAQLQPADTVLVGTTLRLQIDVLVDSWFKAAPRLAELHLEGAAVTQPDHAEQNLSLVRNGTPLFGLRYSYLITPRRAGIFSIPPLPLQLLPSQANAPLTLRTPAITFTARLPTGAEANQPMLVAEQLEAMQRLTPSSVPLRVGARVVREVVLEATGAQVEDLPTVTFPAVEGLRAYPAPESVEALRDGRGGFIGARRITRVDYLVERSGRIQLPVLEIPWWDPQGKRHSASLAALDISAQPAGVSDRPFAILDAPVLRRQLARHGRTAAVLLAVSVVVFLLARSHGVAVVRGWKQWHRTREASAGYAWRSALRDLQRHPTRLDGLYVWTRRSSGHLELRRQLAGDDDAERALEHHFRARFGALAVTTGEASGRLIRHLRRVRQRSWRIFPPARGAALRPLRKERPHP